MFDFMRIGENSYVLYRNGKRITPYPLTKEELFDKLFSLKVSDEESLFIERFYGGEENVGNS